MSKTRLIIANSFSRNVVQDPFSTRYTINFSDIEGVISIRPIKVSIPNKSTVTNQPGILLVLQNFDVLEDGFSQKGISYLSWSDTTSAYLKVDSANIETRKSFDPPLRRLSKLTISFQNMDGTASSFSQPVDGGGAPVTPLDPLYQAIVLLEITTAKVESII